MAGYRRVISYIYVYENNERKEQRGFAKLYARKNEWRIELLLKDMPIHDRVYLYAVEDGGPKGVYLGKVKSEQGCYTWKGTLNPDSWTKERFEPEHARGICIGQESEIRYACEWDDHPVDFRHFQLYQEQNSSGDERREPTMSEPEILEPEVLGTEILEPEIPEPKQVFADRRQKNWEYLTQRFQVQAMPQMEGDTMEYIRIGPKDLQKLPRNCWILGNNSFLLHGYYQYGHLLLCRRDSMQQVE